MRIDEFLASHDGVVSRDQARRCGLDDDAVARRVASGRWVRLARAVYLDIAWPYTVTARVRVAAAWAGPHAALTAVTAAWWWGLEVDDPRPITVALPHGASRKAPPGVTVVQRDMRSERAHHRDLWVVRKPLAVLDAAVALGSGGQRFLDRALQRHVTLEDLSRAQSRHLGRRGSPAAGRLLARAGDRAASEAERRTIALLREAGITGWTVNLSVALSSGRSAMVDLAFPGVKLAIEVDGWAHHEDVDRFVGGRRRKRALVADGWTVVELTWDALENEPAQIVADLRRTLTRLASAR